MGPGLLGGYNYAPGSVGGGVPKCSILGHLVQGAQLPIGLFIFKGPVPDDWPLQPCARAGLWPTRPARCKFFCVRVIYEGIFNACFFALVHYGVIGYLCPKLINIFSHRGGDFYKIIFNTPRKNFKLYILVIQKKSKYK